MMLMANSWREESVTIKHGTIDIKEGNFTSITMDCRPLAWYPQNTTRECKSLIHYVCLLCSFDYETAQGLYYGVRILYCLVPKRGISSLGPTPHLILSFSSLVRWWRVKVKQAHQVCILALCFCWCSPSCMCSVTEQSCSVQPLPVRAEPKSSSCCVVATPPLCLCSSILRSKWKPSHFVIANAVFYGDEQGE